MGKGNFRETRKSISERIKMPNYSISIALWIEETGSSETFLSTDLHIVTYQKIVNFVFTAVITSDLTL